MNKQSSQCGMTLIEIMIALLIGAFLIGGAIQLFLDSKRIYRMQEGLSRLQENGRFAIDYLAKDIRMAGFLGCNSKVSLHNTCTAANTPTGCVMPNNLQFTPTYLYNFEVAIQGFEATSAPSATAAWSPTIDSSLTSLSPAPISGSDVITIRKAVEDQSFTVTAPTGSPPPAIGTSDLTVDTVSTATTDKLKAAEILKSDGTNNCAILIISDCSTAEIFQVSGLGTSNNILKHATGGSCTLKNANADLGISNAGDLVYPINTVNFYIANNANNKPSLYRAIGTKTPVELVEGIEQMQILYGVDTDATPDGTANYYIPANNVTTANWPKVVSVRISLLAVTLDDNLTTTRVPYTYNSSTATTPTDYKLRRVFTTTIALRNRIT